MVQIFHVKYSLAGWTLSVHDIRNLTTDQLVTYLDGFHGTDHQNSLHYPGSKPTEQAFGAVQSTGLIPCTVAEELKHPKPEEQNRASGELWEIFGLVTETS